MRFTSKKVTHNNGDKRTITKFAMLPITIGKETRWLEYVTLEQEFVYGGSVAGIIEAWCNRQFSDKKS